MTRAAGTAATAAVTTEGPRGLASGLDPAALTAAGLSPDEAGIAHAAQADLAAGALAVTREEGPRHLTASCLLLTPGAGTWSVALALHAASGQWRQFGGHLETCDRTLREAAVRELQEESQIDAEAAQTWVSPSPVAVREFPVGTSACASHVDVLFAATTAAPGRLGTDDAGITDVAWWNADDLPAGTADDLLRDLPRLLARVERLRGASHRR